MKSLIISSVIAGLITASVGIVSASTFSRTMCKVTPSGKTTVVFTDQTAFLNALNEPSDFNTYYAWGECARYEPHTTPFTPMPAATPQTPKPVVTAKPAATPQTPKPAKTPVPPRTPRPVMV